jgi:PIN domain nuclease of toxin-antitoxin system
MSRRLPDTQLLVWLADRSEELPVPVARMFRNHTDEFYFSLVSIWETAIKFALGRADFTIHPSQLRDGLLNFGFKELPISDRHVIAVAALPHHHRDPFDRLLVAQAQSEDLILMTTDKTLAKYGRNVERFR